MEEIYHYLQFMKKTKQKNKKKNANTKKNKRISNFPVPLFNIYSFI